MATNYKVNGVDLDQIFDPYVSGTKPAPTKYTVNGVDLKDIFAPRHLGTSAPVTKYTVNGVDLNQIFAAKGSVNYALPINGGSYRSSQTIGVGTTGFALIGFRLLTGTTWQVYKSGSTVPITSITSGAIPAGAATVRFTWGAYTVTAGKGDAGGSTVNNAAAATAIASNPFAYYKTATNTDTSGTLDRNYQFTVDFFDSSEANISHSVCTLSAETDGSA